MLQQTTVKAVLPYFDAFLRAFSDVETLAAAEEDDVLSLWAGLGYYSRARNLLKAARLICSQYDGEFPVDFDSALALPGIGRYTSGAILSIAFGLPFPVVDGNVSRVLARYLAHAVPWNTASARALWDLLSGLVNDETVRGRVGDFNQALMELGATVCTPRNPGCSACPLAGSCEGLRLSLQNAIPQKKHGRPLVAVEYTVAVVQNQAGILMCQTVSGPFPSGLWELPRMTGRPGGQWESDEGLRLQIGDVRGTVIHGITHHRIKIHVVEGRLLDGTLPSRYAWLTPQSPGVGLSAYVKKVLAL